MRLLMINQKLRFCPITPLPSGFRFRFFQDGDQETWAQILALAGEFATLKAALRRFHKEFSSLQAELQGRCLILETKQGRALGTAMAWYDHNFQDGSYGRLHWVAITPAYQGQGLARPLITKAVHLLKTRHKRAYLSTQAASWKAIKIYLDCGFRPVLQTKAEAEAWLALKTFLGSGKRGEKADNGL